MKKSTFNLLVSSLLSILFVFTSCKGNADDETSQSEFAPYISAYTGGLVYTTSSIRIQLAAENTEATVGEQISKKLFSFSPSLKGSCHWEDKNTIVFVPEEGALKSGKKYAVQFKLGKVLDVPSELKTFRFSFYVEEKSFSVKNFPLFVSDDDPNSATIKGRIQFSDNIALQTAKEMVSIKHSANQKLSIALEESENQSVFYYTLAGVSKTNKDEKVEITVDGKAIGSSKVETESVQIPTVGTFKVLSVETIESPEFGVQITFSDPVSTNQNLSGLIYIPEVDGFTRQVNGNQIYLYFDRPTSNEINVNIDRGIRNSSDKQLGETYSTTLNIEGLKPQVELLVDGQILPNPDNLLIPFKAVSLRAVDLRIIRIFESNVLMFLQTNTLASSSELRRSGRLVYKKTLRLDKDPSKNLNQWENYSIDLSGIMKEDPGAIYRIEISFKKDYSVYSCDDNEESTSAETEVATESGMTKISNDNIVEEEEAYWDQPYSDYYNSYYDWYYYEWEERDNPCHPSYYMLSERMIACNFMMSDIGLIAKANQENKIWVSTSSITDAKPLSGVSVTAYNYQLQAIGNARTDGDGFAFIEAKGKTFVLVAEANGRKTYLRMVDGEDNSLSRFDTGGRKIEKGIKGYIYGERGVWRPGDTLHLTFVLHDPEKRIPENHPVALEVFNARGQFYTKQVLSKGVNGFYSFTLPTSQDNPTGLWNAYVKLGGTSFHKSLRIETVKPNRLKINLELPGERINASEKTLPVNLFSSWLTGATARDLDARVEMTLTKVNTQFKGYESYLFNNPATDFYSSTTEVFKGKLDSEGHAKFNMKVPSAENAPGMLNANIVTRVFEPGGDASIFTQNASFSPFASYVGLNLNQKQGDYIETDTDHRFDVVTLNADGKLVNRDVEYKIYKISWSWWWQNRSESLYSYVNNSSYTPVASGKLKTTNGKASFNYNLAYPDWGRFLVYVSDKGSGHATGGVVYIDWPGWRGRSNKSDPDGVKMLTFTTDKTSYKVGEDVVLTIPATTGGRALVALENGSVVLDRKWVQMSEKGDTKYSFKATKDMAPNFYIHISLLQAHAQTANDLPIRMYGVMPVLISDKESVLEPIINMPDVLRPETEFTVKVSEKIGRPMTYTVAIVDDGLLDLTNFKTPNAWTDFYAREALGIRTWDMFDNVIGAFSGKYGSLFSTGGDEEINESGTKANRFKPVVKYLGPFSLSKGKTASHKILLPQYVGSVRTMVVAGQDGAYGNAEKTTPVRSPLMILSSLPRVVSTGEEISLPVNVFAMEDAVKNVSIEVASSGLIKSAGKNTASIRFNKPGDDIVFFDMKTGSNTGVETVTIIAKSGDQIAKETIEINVRNPNPPVVTSDNKLLKSGESADFNYHLSGTSNDDWVKLEASRIPSVDISRRFDFLYDYQHYCSEQLTSRAFPMLYISQFKEVSSDETTRIKKNVTEAIKHLYGRQLSNGGIVFWPGQHDVNEWVTNYAGHFLVAAKEKGYDVNESVLNKWKNYQRHKAQNWSSGRDDNYYSRDAELQQAYRLYTLALAGVPELGAMNRLKEMPKLTQQARWRLAAAYAISGKLPAAQELIFNIPTTVDPYWASYTYGSSERDEAMILEALVLVNRLEDAFKQAQKVSKNLSHERYFSTQSTAYALIAMGTLAEKTSGKIDFTWTLNGKKQEAVKSSKAIYQKELAKKPAEGHVSLKNEGQGLLYVNVVSKARPVHDSLPEMSNNLKIDVSYTDLNGHRINVSEVKQGSDFIAVVQVKNINLSSGYSDLALTHIVPSGWEIFNERMTNTEGEIVSRSNHFTYQDIRDDRVLTYFDLGYGQTKTIKIRLQASYVGSFVLPAVQCEAMYDTEAQARTTAGRVKVVK